MADLKQFNVQLDRFIEKVRLAPALVAKRTAFELFGRIVRKTPVDTGRARGSWTISVNQADRSVLPPAPPGQVYPPPPIGALDVRINEQIVISNNLPYILELENGHSQQAPVGMAAVSIEEVQLKMEALMAAAIKDVRL